MVGLGWLRCSGSNALALPRRCARNSAVGVSSPSAAAPLPPSLPLPHAPGTAGRGHGPGERFGCQGLEVRSKGGVPTGEGRRESAKRRGAVTKRERASARRCSTTAGALEMDLEEIKGHLQCTLRLLFCALRGSPRTIHHAAHLVVVGLDQLLNGRLLAEEERHRERIRGLVFFFECVMRMCVLFSK